MTVASSIVLSGVPPAHATTDLYWAQQWAPSQIGAPAAWQSTTGAGIRIGVVDTGVDLDHEDLVVKIVASTSCVDTGGNAASCQGSGQDDNGHGTIVSSIAAATTDNGKGTAGVAPGAELVVARSLTDDGQGGSFGNAADVMAGIDWVVANGARIVNLSLGGDSTVGSGPSPLAQAIERAWARGAIPVVAAGNGSQDQAVSAYANLNAVVVGASYRDGSVAPYSVSLGGAKWGLLAPGGSGGDPAGPNFLAENIISATWVPGAKNSYAASSGTSIAAPHVSGALALLLAQGLSREEAIGRMLETADRSRPCGQGCSGRLDVARAVGPGADAPPPPTGAGEGGGSEAVEQAQAGGDVDTPTEDSVAAAPEDSASGALAPLPELLPIDAPGGDTSDRSMALLPEAGSSLRPAASSGSDALVPRGLLGLVVSVTVVSSALLEWLARRDRRHDPAG